MSTLESDYKSIKGGSSTIRGKAKSIESINRDLLDRDDEKFDPFDRRSAYTRERAKSDKIFGQLNDFSLRTGSMGLISAILGTGVLALPNGIAHYGWATSIIALTFSGLC